MSEGSQVIDTATYGTLHRNKITTIHPNEPIPSGKNYFLGWDTNPNAVNPRY
jgi:hypothetical protein